MTFGKQWLLRCVLMVIVGGFAFDSPPAGAIPIVSIQTSDSTPTVGNSFNVSVDITSVTDLFAFQFDITFDPTILAASTSSEGAFLPTGGATIFIPGTIDNTMGTVTFIADSLIGSILGVDGSGALATLIFHALGPGTSSVDLLNVTLLDSALADISATAVGGAVSVINAVPEPSSLFLIGLGVFVLAAARRRRQRG